MSTRIYSIPIKKENNRYTLLIYTTTLKINDERFYKNYDINSRNYLNRLTDFNDYNALQLKSHAVLSDSGTISEESSILNFRALNIREAHERPESMEEASVMMVGLNPNRIIQGLLQLETQKIGTERSFMPVSDYSMPNVSEKVTRIIISYVDYINKNVWKKY